MGRIQPFPDHQIGALCPFSSEELIPGPSRGLAILKSWRVKMRRYAIVLAAAVTLGISTGAQTAASTNVSAGKSTNAQTSVQADAGRNVSTGASTSTSATTSLAANSSKGKTSGSASTAAKQSTSADVQGAGRTTAATTGTAGKADVSTRNSASNLSGGVKGGDAFGSQTSMGAGDRGVGLDSAAGGHAGLHAGRR